MVVITADLMINPERVVSLQISRDADGKVETASLMFDMGQYLRLSGEPAQKAVEFFSSNNSSVGTMAATSEA